MDTQIIEILGRNRLISEILRNGLEVSLPERDRGIDLIAYTDFSDKTDSFIAKPIQMKASTKESFGIWKKYSKFKDLLMVYVWYIEEEDKTITYALTYEEAFKICKNLGWSETISWKEKGGYSTSKLSTKLKELLKPYKMSSKKWWDKITKV
jgi:hypothetical protein